LDDELLMEIASNLNVAAKRLNSYTDSIREINRLEEMKINQVRVDVQPLLDELALDLQMMVAGHNVKMTIESSVNTEHMQLDTQVLYRIVENILNNAIRFANKQISIHMSISAG